MDVAARAQQRHPRESALTLDGISEHLDARNTLMHEFLRQLALYGDGKRIFWVRRVCKRWKALVDGLDNGHWAVLHACTVDDPVVSKFLLSRSVSLGEQAHSMGQLAELDMKAEFRNVLQGHAPNPAMYLVLGLCKQLAVDAACAPRRFTTTFDNELRGFAYYAVWVGTRVNKEQAAGASDAANELFKWWQKALAEVQRDVERRSASRSASDKAAAHDSLLNFVEMMASIPFHACRRSEDFGNAGREQLAKQ
jgi:hypothetical protein